MISSLGVASQCFSEQLEEVARVYGVQTQNDHALYYEPFSGPNFPFSLCPVLQCNLSAAHKLVIRRLTKHLQVRVILAHPVTLFMYIS